MSAVRGLVVAVVVASAVAGVWGCSAQSPVARAEQEVRAKERALADAEAAATDTADAFCSASADYVAALDRYGDVLHDTVPTVGDVTDAGRDLAEPSAAAVDAGRAAVDAREAVGVAQAELADAWDALASALATASSTPPPTPSAPATTAPTAVPQATVARVEQAEDEFAQMQAGITDETPMTDAAEQFNAAAVALETAWLELLVQSGCLPEDVQADALAAAGAYTTALQEALATTGYYTQDVDGVYGPATVAAVESLQAANGLPQTGTVDKATAAALQATVDSLGSADAEQTMVSTAALQQTLMLAGYWDGPVDGQWSDALTAALGSAQEDLGVPVTGVVDAATVSAFQDRIVRAQEQAPTAAPTAGVPGDEPTG